MILAPHILSWRQTAAWAEDSQVEQDLILSRALVEIFSNPMLKESVAFRGGTALHKIFFKPPGRYSEDIDLCRTTTGAAGPIIDELRTVLDPWLGKPKSERTNRAVTLVYRFQTEIQPIKRMKVKIEINVREHYNLFGRTSVPFEVTNQWFSGDAQINTFSLEELLATKLRALYQRKKGRDLFDLHMALTNFPKLNTAQIIEGFGFYMDRDKLKISRAEFEQNLEAKKANKAFRADINALLPLGHKEFDVDQALAVVKQEIISKLP